MSPRRKPQAVDLTEADLQTVANELLRRLPISTPDLPEEPKTIRDVLKELGTTDKERVRRAAIAFSGESKGRPYLSARRRFERYLKTDGERRTAKPSEIVKIAKALRRPRLSMTAGLAVSMTAERYYAGTTTMPAGGSTLLRPERLASVRGRLRDGDELGAAKALLDEWVYIYGLATDREAAGVIGNIQEISVEVIGE